MDRDFFLPLIIGVPVTWFLYQFNIKLSLVLSVLVLAFSFTNYLLNKNFKLFKIIFLFLLIVIPTTLSNYRVILNSRNYLECISGYKEGSLIIIKDSSPSEVGYYTQGKLVEIRNSQNKIKVNIPVNITSNDPLFKGAYVSDIYITNVDVKYVNCKVTKTSEVIYPNFFYKFRMNIINKIYYRTNKPLLVAILMGNKSFLSNSTIKLFRSNGCSHILALSGFHISLISILVLIILRPFVTGNRLLLLSLVVITLFVLFVGVSPSLLRSLVMFYIALYLKLRKLRASILEIVIISFYVVLLIYPSYFNTISFKLSFLALLGIVIISPELSKNSIFNNFPNIITLPLYTSFSAFVATFIIVFPAFNQLYPIGIIVSVIVTPLVTLYIWLGIVSIFIPSFDFIVTFLEKYIILIFNFFSRVPSIDYSLINSYILTSFIVILSIVLVVLNVIRRRDAGRFNIKFKL